MAFFLITLFLLTIVIYCHEITTDTTTIDTQNDNKDMLKDNGIMNINDNDKNMNVNDNNFHDNKNINSRIKRLEILFEQRKDLIDEYSSHILGDRTMMDVMGSHVIKSIKSRPLLPVSDKECYWNIFKERCEPVCLCSWQYKIGDLYPNRSCRYKNNTITNSNTNEIAKQCVEDEFQPGPIRRALLWIKHKITLIWIGNKHKIPLLK